MSKSYLLHFSVLLNGHAEFRVGAAGGSYVGLFNWLSREIYRRTRRLLALGSVIFGLIAVYFFVISIITHNVLNTVQAIPYIILTVSFQGKRDVARSLS